MIARLPRVWLVLAAAPVVAFGFAACGGGSNATAGAAGGGKALSGLFRVDAGTCDQSGTTGSYFRMLQPGGADRYVENGDSPCTDKTWTTLAPGTDGGLRTGAFQRQPDRAFGTGGDSESAAVLAPQPFFAVRFGASTNPSDPQTGAKVAAPVLTSSGGALGGDLRAFSVSWNGQQFNQGSPKPDGGRPGGTRPVTGTYDAATNAYTLEWSSQIVGGPFNGFTGSWHLQGTFQPGPEPGAG